MTTTTNNNRLELIEVATDAAVDDFGEAVLDGLTATRKTLPCRFFYDEEGSQVFEEICDLPEYYLTRVESEILDECADDLAGTFDEPATLVELGSGSSTKTRLIIEAFLHRHGALRYVPVDISRTMLEESAHALLDRYPGLEVVAIAAEYDHGLRKIRSRKFDRKLILWLGSSIGNLQHDQAAQFLARVQHSMHDGDRLLVGIDLRKSREILEPAYDDAAGVTARFNKNILTRINRELGGEFDLDDFEHRAVWNDEMGRVEMHLASARRQTVTIQDLDAEISFEHGETIHTESSHKYSPEEIRRVASSSGFDVERQWLDAAGRFSLNLLAPQCSS